MNGNCFLTNIALNYIRTILIYIKKIFPTKCVLTEYYLFWVVHLTSWVAVVTPTDRPKSARNRCVFELFVALFVLSFCPFDNSAGVGAYVIGLSQISSFFM